jgi:hypothetical protein
MTEELVEEFAACVAEGGGVGRSSVSKRGIALFPGVWIAVGEGGAGALGWVADWVWVGAGGSAGTFGSIGAIAGESGVGLTPGSMLAGAR